MAKNKIPQINFASAPPKVQAPVAAQEENTSRHQMPNGLRLTKDQQRAARAYGQVDILWQAYKAARKEAEEHSADKDSRSYKDAAQTERKAKDACEEYRTAVRSLGTNILRSGLSAAMTDLMRRKEKAQKLRENIAESQIPHLAIGGGRQSDLFQVVNGLDVAQYMLATRETLEVVKWLKRATEALFVFPEGDDKKNKPEDGNHA